MSKVVFSKYDKNRYSKVYPFLRRQPSYAYSADNSFLIENDVIEFVESDEVTYTFKNSYSSTPTVHLTAMNDNINVFIKSITLTEVVIGSSILNSQSVSVVVVSNA